VAHRDLPPPLPPEKRTVGQLVAEALRLYGARFWPSVALGIGPALTAVGLLALPRTYVWVLVPTIGTAMWAAAYVGACRLALGAREGPVGLGFAVAFVAFLPLGITRIVGFYGSDLLALAIFALVVLGAAAALVERRTFADAIRRGAELARADYVHALGGIAALVVTLFLSGLVLVLLLHGFGDQAVRAAAVISLLVLSPVFLLGTALLYLDQAARVVDSGTRPRRRRDADVHSAFESDGAGRSDVEVEP
jgi:hypothetical protein